MGNRSPAVLFIYCGAFLISKDKNPFGIGTEGAIASTHTRISSTGGRTISDYLSVV